ncbi:hypothetical protein [Vibrio parahaemolyticus]|uniref:hypothetical protein n=1 Tax=Vibrio parahaemolyticus TaxID=670 RepID=UPI001FAE5E01|nr:hypothetical protein [Vibrio parahaemolyticus]MCI9718754.1 hypothetical protein [Vibrio parahaemolyticus]
MTNLFKTTVASFVTLSLIGCGGGGSSSDKAITSQVQGKVIDGYVSGATVFLDLNNNGVQDSNEPSSISTDAGEYLLELTAEDQQCLDYVPIIVDVPVGAIDEDLGEVEEAYQMVLPPTKADVDHDSHITPLTTLAWDSITQSLSTDYFEVGCEGIRGNTELHKQLLTALDNSTYDLGSIYNLKPEQIYSDFVAEQDSEAHQLAMKIVEGYQRSFKERSQLIADGYNVWNYSYMYLKGAQGYDGYEQYGYEWLLRFGYAYPTSSTTHSTVQGDKLYKESFTDEQVMFMHVTDRTNVEQDPNGAIHARGTMLQTLISDFSYLCQREVNVENVYNMVDNDFLRYARYSKQFAVNSSDECYYQDFNAAEVEEEFVHKVTDEQEFHAYYIDNVSPLINLDMNNYPSIRNEVESWNVNWEDHDNFNPAPTRWFKRLFEKSGENQIETRRDNNGYVEQIVRNTDGTYITKCPLNPSTPEFSEDYCQTN